MSEGIWSTCVTVYYGYGGSQEVDGVKQDHYGWWVEMDWRSGGHLAPGTMEGTIRTRYAESTLTEAIDYVVAVAKRFGIDFIDPYSNNGALALYYKGGAESTDYPPPAGWRLTLHKEADGRGWRNYDSEGVTP